MGPTPPTPSAEETHSAIMTIVAEFKKADMRITKAGIEYLKIAYSSGLSFSDLKSPYNLSDGLWEETHYGTAEPPDDLCYIMDAWRSDEIFYACVDFNVFKIREALYSRSALFKEVLGQEEAECVRNRYSIGYRLRDRFLWDWLSFMLKAGVIELEDVDNLPQPYKLKDMKAKAEELERVSEKSQS
ncbi:hypothetical protein AA313_de0202656 [Arthrobotrys entomopaga]|nr:hypothetical protein AA313_de0202656 [Arthrobotrys entomopaga]